MCPYFHKKKHREIFVQLTNVGDKIKEISLNILTLEQNCVNKSYNYLVGAHIFLHKNKNKNVKCNKHFYYFFLQS